MPITAPSLLRGDYHVQGRFSADELQVPAASVRDDEVAPLADISVDKLQHRHEPVYSQNGNVAVAADRRTVHVVHGATGLLISVLVGARVAAIGDSTLTVDVKKNGTSVLTAALVLTSVTGAYTSVAATINGALDDLVVGDVLEVDVTISAGTGTLAKGVYVSFGVNEDAN